MRLFDLADDPASFPPPPETFSEPPAIEGGDKGFGIPKRGSRVFDFGVREKLQERRARGPQVYALGDSWLAYPRASFLVGKRANILDHLEAMEVPGDAYTDAAKNGETAVQLTSEDHLGKLEKHLDRRVTDVILFSAGGNDLAGEKNLPDMLRKQELDAAGKPKHPWQDLVVEEKLQDELKDVEDAYVRLLELAKSRSDGWKRLRVVAHNYAVPTPSSKGAYFFFRLYAHKGGRSWIHPHLMAKEIKDPKQQMQIVIHMFRQLTARFAKVAADPRFAEGFTVVDTQACLPTDNPQRWWLNEIHPTSEGFGRIARAVYEQGIEPAFEAILKNEAARDGAAD